MKKAVNSQIEFILGLGALIDAPGKIVLCVCVCVYVWASLTFSAPYHITHIHTNNDLSISITCTYTHSKDSKGNTALHLACSADNKAYVKLLVAKGCGLSIINHKGFTARTVLLDRLGKEEQHQREKIAKSKETFALRFDALMPHEREVYGDKSPVWRSPQPGRAIACIKLMISYIDKNEPPFPQAKSHKKKNVNGAVHGVGGANLSGVVKVEPVEMDVSESNSRGTAVQVSGEFITEMGCSSRLGLCWDTADWALVASLQSPGRAPLSISIQYDPVP